MKLRNLGRLLAFLSFAAPLGALAVSSISDTNKYAYGANVGWINARGDATNGAVIGEYVCSGNLWGANIGWINLGDGTPTNGVRYGNTSQNDFGVNNDGAGVLRGFAYGANVGWINFESNGNPRINLLTRTMDGYAWGANIGWISLSNAFAYVQADTMVGGADGDGDGIPDAWEIEQVGNTNILAGGGSDNDGDKVSNLNEYRSDTAPNNSNDYLRIVRAASSNNVQTTVTWPSRPTRLYKIESAVTFSNNAVWTNSAFGTFVPDGTNTVRTLAQSPATTGFHRVIAVRPYSP